MSSSVPSLPPIEMNRVTVGSMRAPGRVMVEEVNWVVTAGDFWVVGGLQGSGKSDFLSVAGGLMAPVEGTYRFFGEPMPIFEEARLAQRLRLGLVFDGGRLLNHLTIAENVSLPLRYHRNLARAEARAEVRRMLELTELAPWADSTPAAVGRNWQKRGGLARALMLKPEVLLLDNPLDGLDLRHRAWWLRFLDRLSQGHEWLEGRATTLVVATDDMRPWRNRARQFAVLADKRFFAPGDWARLEASPDKQVQDLLAETAQSI